jgi:hypothetical protein
MRSKEPVCYTNSKAIGWTTCLFIHNLRIWGTSFHIPGSALSCMQEIKQVVTNLLTTGVSGLPQDKMILGEEVEDLIGLDEYKVRVPGGA